MQGLQSNIPRLYLIKVAKWFMMTMPIIVLFYQENGLGMREVLTLQAVYSVAIVVLEIPSGYVADTWGRKTTLIIGAVLGCLGFVVYSFSYGFAGFLIAELVLGVGQSFISGSDSAMLYDTLLSQNKQSSYLKYEGRVLSLGNFSETLAALAGGALAEISLRLPFQAQIIVAAIAIPAAITLKEPPRHRGLQKGNIRKILSIVKQALISNKVLRYNILFSSIAGCATLTMAWFIQPYMDTILGFSKAEIGITWAALNLTVGLTSLIAYRIEYLLGDIKTILGIMFFIGIGYVSLAFLSTLWVMPFLVLFYFTRGVATPVLKDYINRLTKSDQRATVLSVRNFVIRIFFAITGPFLGWYADLYDLQSALLLSGILFFVFGSISAIIYLHCHRLKKKGNS
ncbi:MAG: MFS transporter [Bacteroidales bacterium]|jgi:predicted MFS family arabinose efflux permease